MKKSISMFEISDLLPIGLTFVVTGIGIAYGLSVLGDTRDGFITNTASCNSTDVSNCGADYNATGDVITGLAKIPSKMPLIATVVIAALIIGILVRYLMVKYQ